MADRLIPSERDLIDQAVAAGRVTLVAPMTACGLSMIERSTGVIAWAGMGSPAVWFQPKKAAKS